MDEKNYKIKNQYVRQGLTFFVAGTALILAFYAVNNMGIVLSGIKKINDILLPFYLGIVMAYLLCPVYNSTTRLVYKMVKGKLRNPINDLRLARVAATVAALAVMFAVVAGLISMIIPDLWSSIVGLINNSQEAISDVSVWIQTHLYENPELAAFLDQQLDAVYDTVMTWVQGKLVPSAEAIIGKLSLGVIGTFGIILDIFVAVIICVYVLNSKEMFIAQIKKAILALFKPERSAKIMELGRLTNETFGGFINGKIIDSIIIGILCFIAMKGLHIPLPLLISVVVGVTNIIPFFGPFIGAIPSIIILLLIDPIAAAKFGVMVLALQQLDGNIIGPKILGKKTNLASFWVMFAIVVGGGFFGFIGMVLGVPVFAVIYTYISRGINNKLKKKDLPTETIMYEDFSKYKLEDFDKEAAFGTGKNDK